MIIDGKTVYSCRTLAIACQGKSILTIEGISLEGELHPIQQAFIAEDGCQCGFCTPGQILSIKVLLDTPLEELGMASGEVFSQTDPEKRTSVDEVAAKVGNYMIIGRGVRGPNPEKVSVNTFGAHFVEVEVDLQTGKVTVCKVVAAHGFGRVLNPLTLSSQVEGGVIQGMGFGLLEGRTMDGRTGKMTNPNLTDYKVPTIMESPEIELVTADEVDSVATSIGAKGAGEPPIIPQAAAIANAVFDAIGVRMKDLPITPDKILDALKDTQVSDREERR